MQELGAQVQKKMKFWVQMQEIEAQVHKNVSLRYECSKTSQNLKKSWVQVQIIFGEC